MYPKKKTYQDSSLIKSMFLGRSKKKKLICFFNSTKEEKRIFIKKLDNVGLNNIAPNVI